MTTIKLLIFSDSHGAVAPMLDLTEQERPDEILHLGDHLRDAETLSFAFPEIPVVMLPGNCDGWTRKPDRLLLEREGVKLLLAHGHQWRVKSGLALALNAARQEGADVLLYGHTHQAVCQREGELWVMNPGTVGGCRASASYGVLVIEGGVPQCRIVPV